MQILTRIAQALISLFVDDGSLAVIVLVWIAICGVALPDRAGAWQGPVLFIGLGLILMENTLRASRRRGTSR
jgi:uncharacterized protein (DUF58 family)